jgi:superfamily II DNA or RNA helicase
MTAEQRTDARMETEELMYEARRADKKHVVLLAQIQCAGTGLNLQHMDRVIFTTPWWTAALMDQAAGRVLRLGQKEQVVIHHLALREEEEMVINIDDFINMRVEAKRSLCHHLLSLANNCLDMPKNIPVTHNTTEDQDQDPVAYSTP